MYDCEVEGGLYVQDDVGGLLFACAYVCMGTHIICPGNRVTHIIFHNSVHSVCVNHKKSIGQNSHASFSRHCKVRAL